MVDGAAGGDTGGAEATVGGRTGGEEDELIRCPNGADDIEHGLGEGDRVGAWGYWENMKAGAFGFAPADEGHVAAIRGEAGVVVAGGVGRVGEIAPLAGLEVEEVDPGGCARGVGKSDGEGAAVARPGNAIQVAFGEGGFGAAGGRHHQQDAFSGVEVAEEGGGEAIGGKGEVGRVAAVACDAAGGRAVIDGPDIGCFRASGAPGEQESLSIGRERGHLFRTGERGYGDWNGKRRGGGRGGRADPIKGGKGGDGEGDSGGDGATGAEAGKGAGDGGGGGETVKRVGGGERLEEGAPRAGDRSGGRAGEGFPKDHAEGKKVGGRGAALVLEFRGLVGAGADHMGEGIGVAVPCGDAEIDDNGMLGGGARGLDEDVFRAEVEVEDAGGVGGFERFGEVTGEGGDGGWREFEGGVEEGAERLAGDEAGNEEGSAIGEGTDVGDGGHARVIDAGEGADFIAKGGVVEDAVVEEFQGDRFVVEDLVTGFIDDGGSAAAEESEDGVASCDEGAIGEVASDGRLEGGALEKLAGLFAEFYQECEFVAERGVGGGGGLDEGEAFGCGECECGGQGIFQDLPVLRQMRAFGAHCGELEEEAGPAA